MANTVDGDLQVLGTVTAQNLTPTAETVTDAEIAPLAQIDPTKLRHEYVVIYGQGYTTNATVAAQVIHAIQGAGTIIDVDVGAVTAATVDATATIDVKKNGTSILTGTISLTAATAAFALLAGTLTVDPTPVVAGDVISVHITAVSAGAGALAKGAFIRIVTREDAE